MNIVYKFPNIMAPVLFPARSEVAGAEGGRAGGLDAQCKERLTLKMLEQAADQGRIMPLGDKV